MFYKMLQNRKKLKQTNKQLDKGDGLPPAYAFLSARVLRPLTARTEAELTLRHPEHTETPRRRPEVILSRSAPLSAAPVNGSAFLTPPSVILYLLCLQALRVPPLQTPRPPSPFPAGCSVSSPGRAAALHTGRSKAAPANGRGQESSNVLRARPRARPEHLQRSHAIGELISEDYSPVFLSLSSPFTWPIDLCICERERRGESEHLSSINKTEQNTNQPCNGVKRRKNTPSC